MQAILADLRPLIEELEHGAAPPPATPGLQLSPKQCTGSRGDGTGTARARS